MEDLRKLGEPFEPEDVEWFVGVTTKDKTKGLAIPFITNRAVQERLDAVCGPDNWKNEYKALAEREVYDGNVNGPIKKSSQLCGISIWSDTRREWITKWDGAEESDIEAIKGSLSSAMKRAAVQWGIGRYLYYIESPWVEIEQQGKSYIIKPNQQIILPGWALPGGSGKPGVKDATMPTIKIIGYNAPKPAPQSQQQTQTPQQPAPSQGENGNNPQSQAKKLSAKQVERAIKKGMAVGQSKENILIWIEKKYGVTAIEDLSRQQYDELCATLDRQTVQ